MAPGDKKFEYWKDWRRVVEPDSTSTDSSGITTGSSYPDPDSGNIVTDDPWDELWRRPVDTRNSYFNLLTLNLLKGPFQNYLKKIKILEKPIEPAYPLSGNPNTSSKLNIEKINPRKYAISFLASKGIVAPEANDTENPAHDLKRKIVEALATGVMYQRGESQEAAIHEFISILAQANNPLLNREEIPDFIGIIKKIDAFNFIPILQFCGELEGKADLSSEARNVIGRNIIPLMQQFAAATGAKTFEDLRAAWGNIK